MNVAFIIKARRRLAALAVVPLLALIGDVHAQQQVAQAAPQQAMPKVESVDITTLDLRREADAQKARAVEQPGNNAPVWREAASGANHYSSLPALEAGVLIQKDGQKWRLLRNGVITVYGGWLLLLAALAIAAFYRLKGPIRLQQPPTGRDIERFTPRERLVHWAMAYSFVALAVSGVVMLWGKHFLLPIIGHTLFGWLTYLLKNVHNLVGPLFTVSIIAGFATFVKDNLPRRGDLKWMLHFGGLFSRSHPIPSHRFNAGEKMWFWIGVFAFGIVVSASGWVLDMLVPGVDYYRSTMQISNVIHAVAATLLMAAALGHIYMGTIGTEGALRAMKEGYVDEAWAREHHELWYDDVKSGKIAAQRSPPKAPADASARVGQA